MTINAILFDVERLSQVWAKSVPGLIGRDDPLIGMHLVDDARSPQRGAIATLRVGTPRAVDLQGLGDSARIYWEIKAAGGEAGGKAVAGRGAQALAGALWGQVEAGPVIVTSDGPRAETAKMWVDSVQGPTWVGSPGGQATYRLDSGMVFQAV